MGNITWRSKILTMDIQIVTTDPRITIFGFGAIATNKDYTGTAFKLSSKMWEVIKANGLKNKGKNVWVYTTDDKVFAGVELEDQFIDNSYGLEKLSLSLEKYAYFKHVGPYNLIKQTGRNMSIELAKQGFETTLPYIEIYGHWSGDESKAETELLMSLK